MKACVGLHWNRQHVCPVKPLPSASLSSERQIFTWVGTHLELHKAQLKEMRKTAADQKRLPVKNPLSKVSRVMS